MTRVSKLGPAVFGCSVLLLGLLPLVLGPYHVFVLSFALVFAIACLAVNLLLGYAGLLSFGHASFFGIGAYAGGFLFTFGDVTSFEIYLASGVASAAGLSAAIGALCVRTTRIHFSILTLAFTQMLHAVFVSGAAFRPFGTMGKGFFLIGHGGLYLPRFTLAGVELAPEVFGSVFYYIILAAFGGCVAAMWRVVSSPFGIALRAIRDNDTRAAFIGLPVRRYRWIAFVISGTMTGLAGALFGQLMRQVTPQQVGWFFSAEMIVAAMLGGTRHFIGPVLGALAVVLLTEVALRFPLYHRFVLGVLLIAVVVACPGGIAELLAKALNAARKWRVERA